jgi:predicted outer membrane repeat protein
VNFRNNSAAGDGGAISASGSSTDVMMLSNMEFNTATNGGAVSVVDGAIVQNSARYLFTGNIAKTSGGAFYIRNTTLRLSIVSQGNTAGSDGGSIYIKNARLSLEYGLFYVDTVSDTRSNNLWIDDDDDPSDRGSFVSCVGDDGALDLGEVATGPGQTQKFRNSNCTQRTRRPTVALATPVNPISWPFPPQPVPPPYAAIVCPPS